MGKTGKKCKEREVFRQEVGDRRWTSRKRVRANKGDGEEIVEGREAKL